MSDETHPFKWGVWEECPSFDKRRQFRHTQPHEITCFVREYDDGLWQWEIWWGDMLLYYHNNIPKASKALADVAYFFIEHETELSQLPDPPSIHLG